MKLLRWALAGASAYVVYKYTIGKTDKGEDVFPAPAPEEPKKPKPRANAAPRKPRAAKPKTG
jgi:hypothetical protein